MPRNPYDYSQDPYSDRIGELIRARGDIAARQSLESGDIWGRGIQNIGGQLGAGVQQYAQQREEKRLKEEEHERLTVQEKAVNRAIDAGDVKALFKILPPDKAKVIAESLKAHQPDAIKTYGDKMTLLSKAAQGVEALPAGSREKGYQASIQSLMANQVLTPEEAQQYGTYDPEINKRLAHWGEKPKEAEAFTLGPEQIRYGPSGEVIAKGAEKAPTAMKAPETQAVGGRVMQFNPQTGRYDIDLGASEGALTRAAAAGKGRELRPILSGDIEDLATMQESVDLAKDLSTAVKSGKIGAGSRLGVMVPDILTEVTGLGAESKATQASIVLAKQIIGKGLEGGVLRKEDESKYEKMLPKVGDPPKVAQDKLDQLTKAIQTKMNRRLEALEDAGRDVSGYRARLAAGAPVTPAGGGNAGAPAVGTIEEGYRYKGGDPADPSSWEKQ